MFPLVMFFIACEERQFLYLDLVKKHQVLNYKHQVFTPKRVGFNFLKPTLFSSSL